MMRNRRLQKVQSLDEIAHARFASRAQQRDEDAKPARIGKNFQKIGFVRKVLCTDSCSWKAAFFH